MDAQLQSRRDKKLRIWLWENNSLWLFLSFLSLYLSTMGGQLFTSDGVAMYRTTQAIVQNHTLAVEPDAGLPQLITGWDGQSYSYYDLGQPLIAIPFYLVGWSVAKVLPRGNEIALTVFSVSLLPQVATALAGVGLYQVGYLLYRNRRTALAISALWGTGTVAWPYSKFYFSESLLTLFLLFSCWLLLQASQKKAKWELVLAGGALGVAVSIRVSTMIYFPAFVIYLLIDRIESVSEPKSSIWPFWTKTMLFTVGVLPAVLLFLGHNYLRFHNIWRTGYEGQAFTTPLYVGLYGFLFSSGRSLFLYSPVVLLGVASFPYFQRHFAAFSAFLITACATVLPFYGLWWTWHGGWSWGPRFLVPLIPFLVVPLGAKLTSPQWRIATALVWLGSLFAVIPGISVDFNQYIIDSIQGDYANENRLWFFPWHSPLLGHWKYLLNGKSTIFAGYHLSDFGLPNLMNQIFLPGMGIMFLCSLVRTILLYQKAE